MKEFDLPDLDLPEVSDYYKEPKNKKEKINEWNEKIFKDSEAQVVSNSSLLFFKIITFLFFVLLLGSFIFFCYMIYNDKLDGLIKSEFNQTTDVDVNNEYKFSPETSVQNDYQHDIYVNNTHYINIINECDGG